MESEKTELLAEETMEAEKTILLAEETMESEKTKLLAEETMESEKTELLAGKTMESEETELLAGKTMESEKAELLAGKTMESGKPKRKIVKGDKSTPESKLSAKKTPKSLKTVRKIVKKSSNLSSTGTKEAKIIPQVQPKSEDAVQPVEGQEGNKSEGSTRKKRILTKANKEQKLTIEKTEEMNQGKEGNKGEGSTGKKRILTMANKELKLTIEKTNELDEDKEGNKSEGSTGKKRILTMANKELKLTIEKTNALDKDKEGNKSEGSTGKKKILTKANKEQKLTSGKTEEMNQGKEGNKSEGSTGKKRILKKANRNQKLTSGKTEEMNKGKEGNKSEGSTGKKKILTKANKEQKLTSEKTEEMDKGEQEDRENLGGLIFMCNARTKPDCFHYQVLGVTANKQELVMSIKPGLKLFLYDYEQRIMYGIYEASSGGGMRLEPAAFGGSFPVQVRFKVHEDCLPLPESAFKKAMKENYDEKTRKFKTYLTVQQVKKLSDLFRHAPRPHSNAESSDQKVHEKKAHRDRHFSSRSADKKRSRRDDRISSQAADTKKPRRDRDRAADNGRMHLARHPDSPKAPPRHPVSPRALASSQPLFLSEKEYRSYGLRPGRHVPTHLSAPVSDHYNVSNDGRNERLMYGGSSREEKEAIHPGPFFLSEKEYRVHGLKAQEEQLQPKLVMPAIETGTSARYNFQKDSYYPYHHDDTTSLVERYLSMPMPAPSEPYSLTTRGGAYTRDSSSYMENNDTRNHHLGRTVLSGVDRLYSTYASSSPMPPLEYNQKYYNLSSESGYVPVSSRYSSAGPSTAPYR